MLEPEPIVKETPRNPQEWLDIIVSKSLAGKFPCKTEYDICMLRHKDMACVIGLLIPDSAYKISMEDGGWVISCSFEPMLGHLMPDWATRDELAQVQRCHDKLSVGPKWVHKTFIERLLQCDIFKGLKPSLS
jgi:hypothetical protein